ncbi:MAG TPA: HAMP domain-containing sensor histidine kinase [Steroidobacteraceae bacterium]|nr:HAMP domain-containing sensor histidine kinase [Steroidobacteraceae bacterium]
MEDVQGEIAALALHLRGRREPILQAWQTAIRRDPELTTGEALPRVQLLDHIPSMLATFERALHAPVEDAPETVQETGQQPAAAHGLQRWRQGYDLREVMRELGKLNECVVAELDAYTAAHPDISHAAIAGARRVWAAMCGTAIEASVCQYFELQKQEAAGHVRDLENAMAEIQELEQQRGDLWRQAAHDLRGNLSVVANATVALTHSELRDSSRDDFVGILMRNVTSFHHLLDDVTSLARLQAGREQRRIEPLDVTPIMQQLCEGIRPLAQQHRLFLRCEGPAGFAAEGDPVKIRRIAQNLILNAVKFTQQGGITVSWGDSDGSDKKRWALSVRDTGPGLHSEAGNHLSSALEGKSEPRRGKESRPTEGGEGIGLSIVKRLCDMLDASIELQSVEGVGTTFRILFPRQYS